MNNKNTKDLKIEITWRKINELIPAEYNPRKLTEKEYEDIKNGLDSFGFVDPIVINRHPDRKNVIVGGHMRINVYKKMGKKEVPCVHVELEKEKEMELNVRLNKNTGRWDHEKLKAQFEESKLINWGFMQIDLTHDWNSDLGDTTLVSEVENKDIKTIKIICQQSDKEELRDFIELKLKETSFEGVDVE